MSEEVMVHGRKLEGDEIWAYQKYDTVRALMHNGATFIKRQKNGKVILKHGSITVKIGPKGKR